MRERARLLVLAGLVLLVTVGCSTRDHDNPLDPENPVTGGSPRWLDALAGDGLVDLVWTVDSFRDLKTLRLVDTGTGTTLWSGTILDGTFTHRGVPNGVERSYRLELELASGTRIALPEELGTPGTAVPWVLDTGTGTLSRLTPDGRRVRTSVFRPNASTLAVDPDSASILVIEFFSSSAILVDREGEERWRIEDDLFRPSAGLHVEEGWWISDAGLGAVFQYDEGGARIFADSSFTFPVDLAPGDSGSVWVVDRAGPVVRLHPQRGIVAADTLDSPFAVCETGDGGVWVADRDARVVVRLDSRARETHRTVSLPRVEGLTADPISAGAWVADRNVGRVLLLDETGTIILAATGFPAPSSLAVSPDGQDIWVADPVLGEIVRLDRSGETVVESEGLSAPLSVSIAFAPAPAAP